jgi:hypothetical protein
MLMIELTPDCDSYSPGSTIIAKISLSLPKPTKARGIFATLVCSERSREKVTKVIDQYDFAREHELGVPRTTELRTEVQERSRERYRQEKQVAGEGTFQSGEYQVQFQLPEDAPPTSREFGHDNKIHIWTLSVKLDIPLALDANNSKEIFVSGLGE